MDLNKEEVAKLSFSDITPMIDLASKEADKWQADTRKIFQI